MKNPLSRGLSKRIRIGVWSSLVSAFMLIGIGFLWLFDPNSTELSFSIVPDSEVASALARLVSIFKGIGDIIGPVFVLIAIFSYQFRLAGYFQIVILVLVIVVDMIIWGMFVPNATPIDVLMHTPFAIPIVIAAYNFLKVKD